MEYDPKEISLGKLLEVFFLVIDPKVENRQGNDWGSQYQTGVYYSDPEEKKRNIHPFCVELSPLKHFWPAEEYHQDYLDKNPGGYCHISSTEMAEVRDLLVAEESEE